MIISSSEAEALMNASLGGATYTPVANWYVGLVTDDPTDDGSGYVEVTGGSYARVTKANNTTNWAACVAGSRQKKNSTVITFPQATAPWGAVVGVILVSTSSAGNASWYAPLPASETVTTGNIVSFAVDQLKFTSLV